jgi:hypothetical protein
MGRSLSFFERLGNFCVRCNEVVKNIVHQMAALYVSALSPCGSPFTPTPLLHFLSYYVCWV